MINPRTLAIGGRHLGLANWATDILGNSIHTTERNSSRSSITSNSRSGSTVSNACDTSQRNPLTRASPNHNEACCFHEFCHARLPDVVGKIDSLRTNVRQSFPGVTNSEERPEPREGFRKLFFFSQLAVTAVLPPRRR